MKRFVPSRAEILKIIINGDPRSIGKQFPKRCYERNMLLVIKLGIHVYLYAKMKLLQRKKRSSSSNITIPSNFAPIYILVQALRNCIYPSIQSSIIYRLIGYRQMRGTAEPRERMNTERRDTKYHMDG